MTKRDPSRSEIDRESTLEGRILELLGALRGADARRQSSLPGSPERDRLTRQVERLSNDLYDLAEEAEPDDGSTGPA
ncbi:MAG TPA: hypothetical protein VIV06_12010 [Candidatus Limnocylindrales bacterium]